MGPDTPIQSKSLNGPAYIANTTVDIPQALTNADASFTQAKITSNLVRPNNLNNGGLRDQPVTTKAYPGSTIVDLYDE